MECLIHALVISGFTTRLDEWITQDLKKNLLPIQFHKIFFNNLDRGQQSKLTDGNTKRYIEEQD